METKNKLILAIATILLAVPGCTKYELSPVTEGYVVGTFRGLLLDKQGNETGRLTKRGFCVYVEGFEHPDFRWPLDFYTFDLPENFFDFPKEVLGYMDADICGPIFFPDSLRARYKIRFKYRNVSERKRIKFGYGICFDVGIPFPWEEYKEVSLKDVERVEK